LPHEIDFRVSCSTNHVTPDPTSRYVKSRDDVQYRGEFEAPDAPDFCQYADGYDVGDTRVFIHSSSLLQLSLEMSDTEVHKP